MSSRKFAAPHMVTGLDLTTMHGKAQLQEVIEHLFGAIATAIDDVVDEYGDTWNLLDLDPDTKRVTLTNESVGFFMEEIGEPASLPDNTLVLWHDNATNTLKVKRVISGVTYERDLFIQRHASWVTATASWAVAGAGFVKTFTPTTIDKLDTAGDVLRVAINGTASAGGAGRAVSLFVGNINLFSWTPAASTRWRLDCRVAYYGGAFYKSVELVEADVTYAVTSHVMKDGYHAAFGAAAQAVSIHAAVDAGPGIRTITVDSWTTQKLTAEA